MKNTFYGLILKIDYQGLRNSELDASCSKASTFSAYIVPEQLFYVPTLLDSNFEPFLEEKAPFQIPFSTEELKKLLIKYLFNYK